MDIKALAVSTAGAGILTLVATLREDPITTSGEAILWILAFASWIGEAWASRRRVCKNVCKDRCGKGAKVHLNPRTPRGHTLGLTELR